jgi:hypothetical protein
MGKICRAGNDWLVRNVGGNSIALLAIEPSSRQRVLFVVPASSFLVI